VCASGSAAPLIHLEHVIDLWGASINADGVAANAVDAWVVDEQGSTSVFLWFSARIAGRSIEAHVGKMKVQIQREVRQTNITVIEGIGASQYGFGIASARIVEAIVRDKKIAIPVSPWHSAFGVSLSMPSVIGALSAL
jgi:L-lactate dehydrogenase